MAGVATFDAVVFLADETTVFLADGATVFLAGATVFLGATTLAEEVTKVFLMGDNWPGLLVLGTTLALAITLAGFDRGTLVLSWAGDEGKAAFFDAIVAAFLGRATD